MGMRNTLKTYDVLLAISMLLNNAIHFEMQGEGIVRQSRVLLLEQS